VNSGVAVWVWGRFESRFRKLEALPCIARQIDQNSRHIQLWRARWVRHLIALSNVRHWVNIGRDLFNSSSSGFDPKRSFAASDFA
jgi:hypothetical protein